jgi:hypothetical protein
MVTENHMLLLNYNHQVGPADFIVTCSDFQYKTFLNVILTYFPFFFTKIHLLFIDVYFIENICATDRVYNYHNS